MNEASVRTVPNDYSYKWLLAAWEITKRNYSNCLIGMLIMFVALLLLAQAGWVGSAASAILSPIWGAGFLLCTRTWVAGGKTTVGDFFQAFQKPELVKALVPFLIMQVGLAVAYGVFKSLPLSGLWLAIFVIFNALTWFTVPLIVLAELPFGPALSLSIKATLKNISALLLGFILFVLVVIVSAIMLLIPLMFVVIPATITINYIIYSTVFDGLDLDTILPKKNPPPQL